MPALRSGRHRLRRPNPARQVPGRSLPVQRPQSRHPRDRRRRRAGKTDARPHRRSVHGLRAPRRTGPGPGAAGRARRKAAGFDRCDHHQQGVRLRHEGDHAGARHHQCRLGRDRAVRRHGEHDQRAVSAGEGARRLPRRPRPHHRPHADGRPRGRLRDRPLDGRFRRGHRRGLSVHPRRSGRLCDGNAHACPQGGGRRRVQGGDRADRREGKSRRSHHRE